MAFIGLVFGLIIGLLLGRLKSTKPLYPNQVVAHIWMTAKQKANSLVDKDDATTDDFIEAQDLKNEVRLFCDRIYSIDPKTLFK